MKKNTFLYIVIAVLVIALAGLGALNVRSLDKLASLQTKVNKLQKSVQEVSDSAAELSSKADQLLAARTVLLPLRKKELFPHPAEALSQTIRIPAWTTF